MIRIGCAAPSHELKSPTMRTDLRVRSPDRERGAEDAVVLAVVRAEHGPQPLVACPRRSDGGRRRRASARSDTGRRRSRSIHRGRRRRPDTRPGQTRGQRRRSPPRAPAPSRSAPPRWCATCTCRRPAATRARPIRPRLGAARARRAGCDATRRRSRASSWTTSVPRTTPEASHGARVRSAAHARRDGQLGVPAARRGRSRCPRPWPRDRDGPGWARSRRAHARTSRRARRLRGRGRACGACTRRPSVGAERQPPRPSDLGKPPSRAARRPPACRGKPTSCTRTTGWVPGQATRCARPMRRRSSRTVHATELGRHQGHLTSTTSEAINSVRVVAHLRGAAASSAARGSCGRGRRARSSCPGQDHDGAERRRAIGFRATGVQPAAGADAPLIVSWGRLEYEKGFQTLIAAVARLAPRWPALRCVLAGRGSYSASCEAMAARARVADIGATSRGSSATTSSCGCCTKRTCAVIPIAVRAVRHRRARGAGGRRAGHRRRDRRSREVLTATGAGLVFPPGNAGALARVRANARRAGAHREVPSRRAAARSRRRTRGTRRRIDPRGLRRRRRPTEEEVQAERRQGQVMKALRSFTVRPRLPEPLAPAGARWRMNLRWSWDEQTRDLFRWVDPDRWDATSARPGPPARPRPTRPRSTRSPTTPASCGSSTRSTTSSSATSTGTAGSS